MPTSYQLTPDISAVSNDHMITMQPKMKWYPKCSLLYVYS